MLEPSLRSTGMSVTIPTTFPNLLMTGLLVERNYGVQEWNFSCGWASSEPSDRSRRRPSDVGLQTWRLNSNTALRKSF